MDADILVIGAGAAGLAAARTLGDAGRRVLVQQDYVHGMLPWMHITMELLADAVEHLVDVSASRGYAVTGCDTSAEMVALAV